METLVVEQERHAIRVLPGHWRVNHTTCRLTPETAVNGPLGVGRHVGDRKTGAFGLRKQGSLVWNLIVRGSSCG